ncbi:ketopantoate reductase family protein [Deinococcus radiophilus]|uniref:2-dehydropantoate 2-reductase n=1 Tax=Deinococcus radiophilus TaxID=32062 RepID=A0A3S0I7U9_9DEIO|nr:ketopantoate reductase family protein [Deinococcus radiophilus]RTR29425.1 ketopantoate reductase family protein [Deinococcus radiophilus]UFA50743.1 ketopantoate reductase family protein [Deinococcus radiophilus]
MQDIVTVSVIGLGALGILFGGQLAAALPAGTVRVVADQDRLERYREQGIYFDGERVPFDYLTPDATPSPADLALVCVKFHQLEAALPLIASQLGPDTLIVSALNGIASEAVLAEHFGPERIVYAVAQEMDARKDGNRLVYRDRGQLVIGAMTTDPSEAERVERVARFSARAGLPHTVVPDMPRRLWGKWMLNVGVNQTVALYQGTFDTVQRPGEARETFKAAMREVLALAPHEGTGLTEADFDYWVRVMDALDPAGKPSMRQDLEAGRQSELELFAGTVLALGQKHGVPTPVNERLYQGIQALQARQDV